MVSTPMSSDESDVFRREHFSLEGRVAIVTGASRNIGAATADLLAEAGAAVVVTATSFNDEINSVVAGIRDAGGTAEAAELDVSSPNSIRPVVDYVWSKYGTLDIVVNNAAIRPGEATPDITIESWDRVLGVNLRGPFFLAQAALPGMRKQGFGRIINIAGLDAEAFAADSPHVMASKAGLLGLTRSLAAANADSGITVNAISPGVVARNDGRLRRRMRYQESDVPVGRFGRPEEIASTALFLSSDTAAYITGQAVVVSGGL